jgi:ubiquinone/menaquinone biosynthesis C-methylase UbiE
MGETAKARNHRLKDGWFEKYAPDHMSGIDIGCQHDPLNQTFRRWDLIFGDPDATYMEGVEDNKFQTVYASHVLEHLPDPETALKNWYRILRPGGHLIVLVPHRELYERKKELPSNWNFDHKWFWLPEGDEPPVTKGFKDTIERAIPGADVVSFEVLTEGIQEVPVNEHAVGEFSIEAIIRKPQEPNSDAALQ